MRLLNKKLIFEYQLNLENDKSAIDEYYATKEKSSEDYHLTYEITAKDLNPIFEVFAPEIYMSPTTKVNGSLTGGFTTILSIDSKFDTLKVNDDHYSGNDIQMNISKISDKSNVLAMIYLFSKQQQISKINTGEVIGIAGESGSGKTLRSPCFKGSYWGNGLFLVRWGIGKSIFPV